LRLVETARSERSAANSSIAVCRLGVLPLGTAKNLARSLGFTAPPEEIVAGLERGKKRAFDIGLARGLWGKRDFFESGGGGLLADYLRDVKDTPKKTKQLS